MKVPLSLSDIGLGQRMGVLESMQSLKYAPPMFKHAQSRYPGSLYLGPLEYRKQAQDLLPEFHDRRGDVLRVVHSCGC